MRGLIWLILGLIAIAIFPFTLPAGILAGAIFLIVWLGALVLRSVLRIVLGLAGLLILLVVAVPVGLVFAFPLACILLLILFLTR